MSMIMEVVQKYDIEGIQGDDRLPAMPSLAGYDNYTSSLFKQKYGKNPPVDYNDQQWVDFRTDLMNQFMFRIYTDITNYNKANNKNLTIQMAPSIFPFSKDEYLQDWPTWVQNKWVDYVFPQVYRYSLPAYTQALEQNALKYIPAEDLSKFYPGILIKLDNWYIDQSFLEGIFKTNRDHGVQGEIFFFYEGLKNSTIYATIKNEYLNQTSVFLS